MNEMSNIVQWATILSPVIAVFIAVWTIRKSAKDTDKKIKALDKSTQEQVNNIKKLSILQAEITSLHLDMELWETHFRLHKSSGLIGNVLEDNRYIRDNLYKVNLEGMTEEERKRFFDEQFFNNQLNNLEGHVRSFERTKEQLGIIGLKMK